MRINARFPTQLRQIIDDRFRQGDPLPQAFFSQVIFDLARHINGHVFICRWTTLDVLDIAVHSLPELLKRRKLGNVKRHKEVSAALRALIAPCQSRDLTAAVPAQQRAGQQIHDDSKAEAFMRSHRTEKSRHCLLRVSCRIALVICRPAKGNVLPLARGKLNLAVRHSAARHIQHYWRIDTTGNGKGNGIVANHLCRTSRRRHQRRCIRRGKADHIALDRHLRIICNCAVMVAVLHADAAHTIPCGLIHGKLHCICTADLAKGIVPVNHGDRTVILSFGGSLGARRVNEVVSDLCAWEQREHKPVLHLHATGQYGVQLFKDLEQQKHFAEGGSLVVKEYINNMPELLAAADLIISRAGALTLAELEAVGRAAVLIPSPNVAENHQYFNAMELQKAGAAVVIEEKDLTGEKLISTVSEMLAEPGKLAQMGQNARSLSVDDSLDRIADALMKLVQKH